MGFQKVIIAGNIGKLNELRYSPQGKAVITFSVAVTEGFDKDHTEWFQCEVWDKPAEAVSKFMGVGSYVIVEGRLKTRKWEDKEGNNRYSTDLKASRVEFGPGSSQRSDGGTHSGQRPDRPAQRQDGGNAGSSSQYDEGYSDDSDTIPF